MPKLESKTTQHGSESLRSKLRALFPLDTPHEKACLEEVVDMMEALSKDMKGTRELKYIQPDVILRPEYLLTLFHNTASAVEAYTALSLNRYRPIYSDQRVTEQRDNILHKAPFTDETRAELIRLDDRIKVGLFGNKSSASELPLSTAAVQPSITIGRKNIFGNLFKRTS